MIKKIITKIKNAILGGKAKEKNEENIKEKEDKNMGNINENYEVSQRYYEIIRNAIVSFFLIAFNVIDFSKIKTILDKIFYLMKKRDKAEGFALKSISLFYATLHTGQAHIDLDPYIFIAQKINNDIYEFIIGELEIIDKLDNFKTNQEISKNLEKGLYIKNNYIFKVKNNSIKIYKIVARNRRALKIVSEDANQINQKEKEKENTKAIIQRITLFLQNKNK